MAPRRTAASHHRGVMDSLLPDRILRQALTSMGKRYTLC